MILEAALRIRDMFSPPLRNARQALRGVIRDFGNADAASRRMGADFRRAMDQARPGNFFDEIGSMGQKMTMAGLGIAAGLGMSVKTAMDFDAQMSKVAALSGAVGEEFQKLRKQAIDLGSSTSFSASESAEAMQMLAASGMDANKIMGAMPGVLSAAAASGEEMALVADVMGSALNTFKIEATQAGHVADVLAKSANMSAIGLLDMQYSLKYAAPVAAQLGISLEELSAAMVIMGNAGIKGETAGTTLRGAMLRLIDPPAEAAKSLNKLKVSIVNSKGQMKPFKDIISQLQVGMKGMSEAQKAATLSTIFGTEAVSGMMVLLGAGSEKFDDYTQSLINSTGASADAAKVMQDNLKGSIDQLSGAAESAGIAIGTALTPAVRKVADELSSLVNWFNGLSQSTQSTIAISAAVTAGLLLIGGPILILIAMLPSIITGVGLLASAFLLFNSAVLANPITWIIMLLGLLIAVGVETYRNWDTVGKGFARHWEIIKTAFTDGVNWVTGKINVLINALNSIPLVNIPNIPSIGGGSKPKGHAYGISYVPYDNYPSLLHRGETVLTRAEADQYRGNSTKNVAPSIVFNITAANMSEDQIVSMVENKLIQVASNMGVA